VRPLRIALAQGVLLADSRAALAAAGLATDALDEGSRRLVIPGANVEYAVSYTHLTLPTICSV